MEYLAAPYTHQHAEIRRIRTEIVTWAMGTLMTCGYHIFSPLTHSHGVAQTHDLPTDWDYWEKIDRKHLERCDRLFVLCIPGWEFSTGVLAEIKMAAELCKPISYIWWDDLL